MSQECIKTVEQWKIRKLIQTLDSMHGNGTSMISLIVPPKSQLPNVLNDELGKANNIKSRTNRQAVTSAIVSAQQRLKRYHKVPENGLILYCGTVIGSDAKEKKITIDFEPWKPINTSLYYCDSHFHTEALQDLLESDKTFGFIVMDGSGTLFGTLSGNTRTVLHKFNVDLPKKHGRGGQSSVRFARIRLEKRHNYLHKVAELATQFFIVNNKVMVEGLVLAGSAEFKNKLNQSDLFDARLSALVLKIVDVSYGGENGFNQAIELASDTLANTRFIHEKKLLEQYFTEIAQDSGKYCFGIKDTMMALEQGAVQDLIVWENLPDVKDQTLLVDWLAEHYVQFGARLNVVSNKSQEGSQFCKGFGGIGGILRYRVEFIDAEEEDDNDTDDASTAEDIFYH